MPVVVIAKPQIEALKRWAVEAGARTASLDTDLVDELRRYSQEQGLGPLGVDFVALHLISLYDILKG